MSDSEWITLREAATIVGMSRPFVERLVDGHYGGEVRDAPRGGDRCVRAGQFQAWIETLLELVGPMDLRRARAECDLDGPCIVEPVRDTATLRKLGNARRASRRRALKMLKKLR